MDYSLQPATAFFKIELNEMTYHFSYRINERRNFCMARTLLDAYERITPSMTEGRPSGSSRFTVTSSPSCASASRDTCSVYGRLQYRQEITLTSARYATASDCRVRSYSFAPSFGPEEYFAKTDRSLERKIINGPNKTLISPKKMNEMHRFAFTRKLDLIRTPVRIQMRLGRSQR